MKSATERTWLKERVEDLFGIENLFCSMLPDDQAACKDFPSVKLDVIQDQGRATARDLERALALPQV